MVIPEQPAVILAPMDGLTDAPMRAVQGEIGAFTYAVAEFLRISSNVPSSPVFFRTVPELYTNAHTRSGMPVHVQLLGGDAGRMAASALVAVNAGAQAIDINFGCPAPTVNSHDGGATLLKYPTRIREIVREVRSAVPTGIPVSAKLRLGWDTTDAIHENAEMAAEGGASWITIHARTRAQGYQPPVSWDVIGVVRKNLDIPVVANGDIWSLASFRRCQEQTGCKHFMLGRGGLADPMLSHQIAHELGLPSKLPWDAAQQPADKVHDTSNTPTDWRPYLQRLIDCTHDVGMERSSSYLVKRLKSWLRIATFCGNFDHFDAIKRAETVEELLAWLPVVEG